MPNLITCPLCGYKETRLIANEVRFKNKADVYRCAGCDLVFLDQGSFSFPRDFYEADYHQTYITHVEPDAMNPKVYYEKMKKANNIWADKFSQLLDGSQSVLDVGCSTGHFIDMVKAKTNRIYGYELNRKEIDFCKDTLKLDVSGQPLEKRFKEGQFDYITMIYVLEHIADPKDFLMSLKKFLKPTGKIVILVPNIMDALVSLYSIPEFISFYYCIEHLFYYSPKTIDILFKTTGLRGQIEVVQEYPITNHLNWSYYRKPANTLQARGGVPGVQLQEAAPVNEWAGLWSTLNTHYKKFLSDNGYGDRIWCVVGPDG